ncbi:MAG: MFS transporter [Nakamurella sp.]
MTADPDQPAKTARWKLLPLYAAGFVTAFGAHSIAASLGVYAGDPQASLLTLGLLLAVYDGAEVILKPVFGALADRIGPRPVLLGGLLAFAAASAMFVLAGNPALLGATRLAQGAAAAAFSPAASAMVARLSPGRRLGRVFGGYGAYKSAGYALGPALGGLLITTGGYTLLFGTLAVLALLVTGWAAAAVPTVPVLPRRRQTVLDLARRLRAANFLRPTLTLAAATAALASGVGFLPVIGAHAGMTALTTGGAVSLLALTAVVVQPCAGRARDSGRLSDQLGMAAGIATAALGLLAAALIPPAGGIIAAALLIGSGTGLATPVAFAHLAGTTPAERLGQTMGAAEVGRELGDAGGPLLVGAVAAAGTLGWGLTTLALVLALIALLVVRAPVHGLPPTVQRSD